MDEKNRRLKVMTEILDGIKVCIVRHLYSD